MCHQAVIEGYRAMLKDANAGFSEWEEENITARLRKEILGLPFVNSKKIDVVREFQLDNDAIISGEKPAKSARRIDFRFHSTWSVKDEYEYFAEAKNLYHTDRRNTGDASKSKNYYIEGGIARFVNGAYPPGFLVGYVLRGEIEEVVNSINQIIERKNFSPRIGQIREKSTLHSHPYCYNSINTTQFGNLELWHIFLKYY